MSSLIPAPRPRRRAYLLVACVATATTALLLVAAGSSFRPIPTVQARPVIFDEHSEQAVVPDGVPAARTTKTIQAPGWLEADPYSVAAAALTDGVIEEILALEGDRVVRGQPVARLIRADAELALGAAEAELLASQAAVRTARAALVAAETEWNEPVERVRALGVARAGLARSESQIAQLPALIAAETAMAEQLAEELERVEQARRSGAANEIEEVVARKKLEAALASVESLVRREPILQAERDLAAAELVAAERAAELRTAERFGLESTRAELARAMALESRARVARDEAALRLERTVITAPIGGLVQARLKYPGSRVMSSSDDPHATHIVHIYDPDRIQARVDVPLADAAGIWIGQPCEVVVEILPDRVFRGEVTRITHQADLQKNTLQIKVRLIDQSPVLKPEMLTRVRILGTAGSQPTHVTFKPTVHVHESAIRMSEGTESVLAVRNRQADKGELVLVPVRVLERSQGWARVEAALHPGDLLALNPPRERGVVRVVRVEDPS